MQIDGFLKSAAKGQFDPVYLLAGTELFFRDKFRQALVKFFLGGPDGEVAEHDLLETPVRDALDDAANLSLFAPRRVVWLRNADAILPKREGQTSSRHSPEAVSAYLARPNEQTVVVFEARLDEKEKIARMEKALPGAVKIELERPAVEDSARYLAEEARRGGYEMDTRTAAELVESTGGDLARACKELEKLMAYAGDRQTVTTEDVREMVTAEPAFIIWELGDSIGRRDRRAALERLEAMLRDGRSAMPILGLIASHMRRLLRAKAGSRQWFPDEVRRQAQKTSLPILLRALDRLHQADLELRSSPPDERLVLERLIFDLAR